MSSLLFASHILSQRLAHLVQHGILVRKRDSVDGRRIQYALTEKGVDLYSVTLALIKWGDRWLGGGEEPPLRLHHRSCGHRLDAVMCCAQCGEPIKAHEVSYPR